MTKIIRIEVSAKFRALLPVVCATLGFIGIYLSIGATGAFAFGTIEMSLAAKAEKSDVVVVGRVDSIVVKKVDPGGDLKGMIYDAKTAVVFVTATLKGEPTEKIRVDYTGPFPEDDPPCCEIGMSYVFFLERNGDNAYSPVDRSYGIYPISGASGANSKKR